MLPVYEFRLPLTFVDIYTPKTTNAPPISWNQKSFSPINTIAKIEANTGIKLRKTPDMVGPICLTAVFQARKATKEARIPTYNIAMIDDTDQMISLFK